MAEFHEALGVGEVVGDEGVVDDGDVAELVRALGDDGLPVLACGMVEVDGDDFAVGRVERGEEPEESAVVVDGSVGGVGGVDEAEQGRVGVLQVLVSQVLDGELVVGAGAFALVEDEVAAVVGDLCADVEFAVVGAVEDRACLRLAVCRVCGSRPCGSNWRP